MNPDVLRFYHRTVGEIAGICGLLANCLLIWMIAKSNTQAFRKVFLQMAIIDIILVIVTAIAEPIVVFFEGSEFVVQNGYFRKIPQPFNGYLVSAWIFGLYFSISSICVQFLYRYLILCRRLQPSSLKFMGLLSVSFVASLGISILFQFGYSVSPDDDRFATELIGNLLLESGEASVHASSVSRQGNKVLIAVCIYVLSIIFINYLIIIFCIIRIHVTLKKARSTMSKETRVLQNQLSWAFGLQALSPLVVSFGPLIVLCYMIIVNGTAFWSMMWMTTGFSWIPFLNAMSTLFIVGEFRAKLMSYRRVHSTVTSFT